MNWIFFLGMALCLVLPSPSEAASFDCSKAKHPVEKAICGSDELSKLDDELAMIYQSRKAFVIQGDTSLVDEQKQWLSEMRKKCKKEDDIGTCVKEKYHSRLDHYLRILPFAASSSSQNGAELKSVWLDDVLPGYDLKLTLEPAPVCGEGGCTYERLLDIFPKGQKTSLQTIVLPYDILEYKIPEMTDALNQKQLFQVVDYNFDGCLDFAIHMGWETISGVKIYWIFLCNKKDGKFYHAHSFYTMIYDAQVLERFEKSKQYKTLKRGSCCDHSITLYKVENNVSVPVRSSHRVLTRELTNTGKEEEFYIFRDEIWKNGAWRLLKERRSTSGDFEGDFKLMETS